jgi:hypothetical protein
MSEAPGHACQQRQTVDLVLIWTFHSPHKIGSKIGGNGWVGYAAQTAGNAGLELLIFVR